MHRFSPHNVLKLTVATFGVSALAVWLTIRNIDPEANPVLAWSLLATLAIICATCFLAPIIYIVKKARLRGHISGATVSASLRQSLWGALLLFGSWALWLIHALTPTTFLLSALLLVLSEWTVRTWTRKNS